MGTKHGKGGVSKSTDPRPGYERPASERYRARVKIDGKEHFLGYFPSAGAAESRIKEFRQGHGRDD